MPAENMALTVAHAQVERGENPTQNISTVLVMALDRLIGTFGDKVLLVESYPNPGDGTALSPEEYDEAHEAWFEIGRAKEAGYLVQVWPTAEEVDDGSDSDS